MIRNPKYDILSNHSDSIPKVGIQDTKNILRALLPTISEKDAQGRYPRY